MQKVPSILLVYFGLLLVQIIFGAGNVIGKVGLVQINPVLFAFTREFFAGSILLISSAFFIQDYRRYLTIKTFQLVLIPGICMFGNQFFFICGLKLGNEVNAAIWQLVQPIYTAIVAILIGWEMVSPIKVFGFICACGGSIFLIYSGDDDNETEGTKRKLHFTSSCFFLMNGVCQSTYIIFTKKLLLKEKFPPLVVAGNSYFVASCLMGTVCVIVNNVESFFNFLAPDCDFDKAWHIPKTTIPALCFWIIFVSVVAYTLMAWTSKYAQASLVASFVVIQPIASALISHIFVILDLNPDNTLQPFNPSNIFPALIIIIGLLLLVFEDSRTQPEILESHSPYSISEIVQTEIKYDEKEQVNLIVKASNRRSEDSDGESGANEMSPIIFSNNYN